MTEEYREKCIKACDHLSALTGVDCFLLETPGWPVFECTLSSETFCDKCTCKFCNKSYTLSYGIKEANRWQGRYVFYCPVGLAFVAASLDEGGIIAGPIVMGDPNDALHDFPCPDMIENVRTLPVKSSALVQHLAEILRNVAVSCMAKNPLGNKLTIDSFGQNNQQDYMNALYEAKDRFDSGTSDGKAYPIEDEKTFLECIHSGDKKGAQMYLNRILGNIFFYSDFKLDVIKSRVIELITLLSREAIAGGADVGEIFSNNTDYIHEIEQAESADEISTWITGIMHNFILTVFDYDKVKHSDIVYKVTAYIKENYGSKLTLDLISHEVGLSSAYLSSVFKQETGVSISAYINKVRVEASKKLLKNTKLTLAFIASECCFETQSYFTKVFKSFTGMTPKQYRSSQMK